MANNIEEKVVRAVYDEYNVPCQLLTPDALTNIYYNYERIESMAKWLITQTDVRPCVGIICGSGLGGVGEIVENKHVISYSKIPDFPRITGVPVVCMQGRFHSYQGYSLALCSMPVKLFKLLGCQLLLATNAAGGLNRAYRVGDLMVIKDHFSIPMIAMQHPLMGPNDERFGGRFLPANKIYDKRLREVFLEAAQQLDVRCHEGVYGTIGGPAFESVTDARFLLNQGCDCSGMSTSHEAMVASYCGMKVLAFSIITNNIVTEFDADECVDHHEVVKIANQKAIEAEKLVTRFMSILYNNSSLLDSL